MGGCGLGGSATHLRPFRDFSYFYFTREDYAVAGRNGSFWKDFRNTMPPAVAAAAASARKAAAERLEQERVEAEQEAERAAQLAKEFELETERMKNSPRKVGCCFHWRQSTGFP